MPPRDVHDVGVRVPAAHTVQSTLPTSELLYLPSAQSVQADPAIPFVDVPSGQAVQSSEEEEPRPDENPAGQSAQFVDPGDDAYLPAAQKVQDERPD